MVILQRGLGSECVDQLKTGLRAERHRHRDRTIQFDDRGRHELRKCIIERDNAGPLGIVRGDGPRVTGGDGRLYPVRPKARAQLLGPLQCGETTTDEKLIPLRAVLIEQQNGLSRGPTRALERDD